MARLFSVFRRVKDFKRLFHALSVGINSQLPNSRSYCSKRFQELCARGLIQSTFPEDTDELPRELAGGKQTVYCGFDPTADSLHLGNLLSLVTLLHLQRMGHTPIIVLGGATVQLGDPSGKTKERMPLKLKEIDENLQSIEDSIHRIFANHEEYFWKKHSSAGELPPYKVLNNEAWYHDKSVVWFLGTVGRHFRLGPMLSRTSVQSRLKSKEGMSFTEFAYQLFQSYDWLHLHDKYDCRFQVGGSDQEGNIHSGHDLIRKQRGSMSYGLTTPLLLAEMGNKYGKSGGNPIWLNSDKTSLFDFYQFLIRLADKDVHSYLKLFTFFSLQEIENIMQKHMAHPENWYAQKKTAESLTLLVHGEDGLRSAERMTEGVYHSTVDKLASLDETEIRQIFQQAALVELMWEPGTTVLDMAMKAKCFPTLEDAQRVIASGGLYINSVRVTAVNSILVPGQHILPNGVTVTRVGKRNYYLVKWV